MEPRMLQLLFILHVLALPVQPCENPKENSPLIRCLNLELLRLSQDLSAEPNPSVYVALRLSAEHNLEKEAEYLQRLMNVSASSSGAAGQPGTGRLALYLLALRAACENMETDQRRQVVTQLKHHLHKEMRRIDSQGYGHPITSYYQYSLAALALCIHGKKVDTHVIQKLLNNEKHKFTHGEEPSMDTEAMAGLAFTCLERANLYDDGTVEAVHLAAKSVTEKILQAQTAQGTFGNIFSSALAVQLLIATRWSKQKPECPKVMAALLESLKGGDFQNPMTMSQLLPVLYGKSYLDIASMECRAESDTLVLDTSCPKSQLVIPGTDMITVQLIVEHPPHPEKLYNHSIQVPAGSSLFDVLTAAQDGPEKFTFKTQKTQQGLFLTTVMGVRAGDRDRRYWQLLRAPDISLEQGISNYQPQNETIILKFRPW
uniref:Transcobalamin-2 n=1 Tax=Pelusios castaneus TaxID=367368 RepID=A0A8C8VFB5_9SAUR